LKYDDSSLKSLITEALCKAFETSGYFKTVKRRNRNIIIPNPKEWNNPKFDPLRKELGGRISGKIPNTSLTWVASAELSLQYKLNSLFLVINPSVLATKTDNINEGRLVAPFIKEFTARWYNDKYDRLLSKWIQILISQESQNEIIAFNNIEKGVNASFKIEIKTAYTKLA
jgi:hypothetical protein